MCIKFWNIKKNLVNSRRLSKWTQNHYCSTQKGWIAVTSDIDTRIRV